MKVTSILTALGVTLLTGCVPQVIADMDTAEFEPVEPSTVRVFRHQDEVPEDAVAIGRMEMRSRDPQTIKAALIETARNGGNGLLLANHLTANGYWGGSILHIEQSVADTLTTGMTAKKAWASISKQMKATGQASYLHRENNIVRLNIGPSLLTSSTTIYTSAANKNDYSSKIGWEAAVDYFHLWNSGMGMGVNYLHNLTYFDEGLIMHHDYLGPCFAFFTGEKVRFNYLLGCGVFHYSEGGQLAGPSSTRFGMLSRLGVEFMTDENTAIGLQWGGLICEMEKPKGFQLDKNEMYGIKRTSLQISITYYF